jgi:GNAT superfamily N-acetyltransferase
MAGTARVPREIALLAEDPSAFFPVVGELPRIENDRFILQIGSTTEPRSNNVERLRLGDVAADVAEVRAELRQCGATGATWWVGPSATPAGITEQLLGCGMQLHPESPLQMLAIDRPPDGVPAGLLARRVRTFGEDNIALEIQHQGFGTAYTPDAEASADTTPAPDDLDEVSFLAWVDGEPAGMAALFLAPQGGVAAMATTLPRFRGHGVFRALMGACYAETTRFGHSWMVAQTAPHSSDILIGMGFVRCGEIALLLDLL